MPLPSWTTSFYPPTGEKVAEIRTALHVAEQDLSIALLGQQAAQLELDRAQAQLEQRVIRHPIDGVVTERLLGRGEYVQSDTHIVVLAGIDPLFVEVYSPGAILRADQSRQHRVR